MKTIFFTLLLAIPQFIFGQTLDSIAVVKQVDSLLRQLRPLIEQQKIEAALQIFDQAQQKTITAFGKTHPAYATCLAFRGKIAQRQEKYKEAEAWYLEAIPLQENLYGRISAAVAISLSTLSSIYLVMGEYIKAEPLILETLNIREKLVGKKHPDYARVLGTLGSLNFHKGYYFKAELLYLEAIDIFEQTLGKKNHEYAVVLANLGSIYSEVGNYTKAEPLMLAVSELHGATLGKQHPFYVQDLVNLANLYSKMGNTSKSISLNSEILEIFNTSELSKESTNYANTLSNLANAYIENAAYDAAEPLVLASEEVCTKIYGKQHLNYATALKNVGRLYAAKGDYTKAESILLAAHKINTEVLEVDHPNCAQTSRQLALLYWQANNAEASSIRFLESERLDRLIIERAVGYSSEIELNNYLQSFLQNTAEFYAFAQEHPSPAMAKASFDNVLFYKGFLLNATKQLKNRALSDTASAQKLGFLHAYQLRLTEQYSLPFAERDTVTVTRLEDKANALEKEIARTVVGYSDALRQVNWPEIQAALKPGEAAVEFIHFQNINARGKATDSTQYAALVLRPEDAAPSFISLFEERELNALMQGASGGNYRKINNLYAAGKKNPKTLYELIWKKIEPSLKGSKKVYCSVSGFLHRLNMGAISLSATETFAERYQLVLLGSTRQLVIPIPTTAYNKDALLVGGVNYAEKKTGINDSPGLSRGISELDNPFYETDSLTRSDTWNFLPATVTEVLNLSRLLQSVGMKVQLDSGFTATEESIKKMGDSKEHTAPRVLHFATHGYFFPDPKTTTTNQNGIAFKTSKNPLLRSGLILAGAQQAWTTGKPPAGQEDGVLTAQEISLLDLSGTELVVLSACETGLGDIDGTEGVYGLQRAFKIAGAKYIVMSLWKVNDQTTSQFMTAFYTQWLKKGLEIPQAFQNAQNQIRAKYSEAYHWAGFVLME